MDISKVKIRRMPLEKLKPADYNPRKKLTKEDKEYQKLEQSLNSFGNVQPVVYNERTGNVVSGHQKLNILQEKGFRETDCVIVNLNDEEEKALNIALNKITGKWDYSKLESVINELAENEYDLSKTGLDEEEIEDLINELDVSDEDFIQGTEIVKEKPSKEIICPNCGFKIE